MGQTERDGIDRRGALECLTWAGTPSPTKRDQSPCPTHWTGGFTAS